MSAVQHLVTEEPRKMKPSRVNPVLILLGILLVAIAVFEPRFYSRLNLINVARNTSLLTLIAIGQAVVMIVGGFDLSIGAIMAFSSVVAAISMLALSATYDPTTVAIAGTIVGLGSGLAIGLLNGLIVLKLRINPFMSTLGMASVIGGLALYLTKGVPIYGLSEAFTATITKTMLFKIPLIVWIGVVAAAALWIVLEYTAFGRHVYAVGGRPTAARASGINPAGPVLFAYSIAGVLAAVAGLLLTARIGSGQATIGSMSAIEAIAAAVVGGVSLRGGIGNIGRVVVAAIFLTVISNVLNLVRVDSKWQTLVLGIAIIFAALVELRSRQGGKV